MATITIIETILSGNLGDGWLDNDETADAYADFIAATWKRDTQEFRDAGHAVEIVVSAQHRTCGYNGDVSITIEADEDEVAPSENDVRNALSDTWTKWCDSEEAKEYWSE